MLVSNKSSVNFTGIPVGKAKIIREVNGAKIAEDVIISKLSQENANDLAIIKAVEKTWQCVNQAKNRLCDAFLSTKPTPIPREFFALERTDAGSHLSEKERILGLMQTEKRMGAPLLSYIVAKPKANQTDGVTLHGVGKTLLGFFFKAAQDAQHSSAYIDFSFGKDFYIKAFKDAGFTAPPPSENRVNVLAHNFVHFLKYMDKNYDSGFLPPSSLKVLSSRLKGFFGALSKEKQ